MDKKKKCICYRISCPDGCFYGCQFHNQQELYMKTKKAQVKLG